MKAKIIILLSLILIAMSSYSYAGDCYYDPHGSISIAEFFAGKCAIEQTQVISTHKDRSRIRKPLKAKKRHRRRVLDGGRSSRLRGLHKQFSRKGYGMRIIRSTNAYGVKVFDYEVNLPCFYTAPGNSPCDRGSFKRNVRSLRRRIPTRRVKRGRQYVPYYDIRMRNGNYKVEPFGRWIK